MSKLYHYTTAQGLVGMIESKKIHCTNYMFMNDPSERTYFDKILKIVLQDEKCKEIFDFCTMKHYHDMKHYHAWQSFLNTSFDSDYLYFLSFIKDRDSLTMWRYYSKPNGCCIEFNDNDIVDIGQYIGGNRYKLIDVIYNRKEQIDTLKTSILSYAEEMNIEKEMNLMDKSTLSNYSLCILSFRQEVSRYKISFKDPAYEDEKEKRLVIEFPYKKRYEERSFLQDCYDDIEDGSLEKEVYSTFEDYYKELNYNDKIKYKTSESGVIVEYLEVDFDPRIAIKSVLLHPSSSEIQQKGVERILKTREIDAKVSISKKPFRVM